MVTRDVLQRSFWALPIGEVLDILETTRAGLTDDDVEERRPIFKDNVLPRSSRLSRLGILFRQFKSPVLSLLLIASVITLFLKDWKDATVILAAVVANITLGFYQENKAETALSHLKSYIKERTRAFRNDGETEIDAAELVPGDVIHLAQGDRIPADCRLIYINDFMVDESILTGESLPAFKTTEPGSFKASLADRKSMVFSGTLVVQGFANAVVCTTGRETELGKIATVVAAAEKEETPLQRALSRFSIRTSLVLIALTLVVFFLGLSAGKPILDMFLIAVAIAVAAVPEGLPIALTMILAIGVQRLSRRNGIVRKILAAETLGNTSIIMTDKTGTLTQAKLDLAQIRLWDKDYSKEEVLKHALLNTDVVVENPRENHEKWRVVGRPLEVALVKAAAHFGVLLPAVKREFEQVNYLPFNSKNKYSASLTKHDDESYIINVFGAPDILLKNSKLPEEERSRLLKEVEKMAYSGERVLGLALKKISSKKTNILHDSETFQDLKFIATISFRDPVRPGAREAIQKVQNAGVRVMIVSGDHRGTTEAVAKELGMEIGPDQVIDGEDLEIMNDDRLKKRLLEIKIITRVSPEGKLRVARALKSMGEVVAMTGDGINDAASLKEADIGIAMGSGTDVAKAVSDLVLLDDNFATIVAAIEEGRRILENIRKVIVYLSASIFDELFLIGGALALGLVIPLSAIQILFVNFISDTFPALALAFENKLDHFLDGKRRATSTNLFDKEMMFLTFVIGVPTSAMLFGVYYFLLWRGFDPELVKTFVFASFSSYSLFVIFSVRSLRRSVFTYNPFSNPFLVVGVALGISSILASIYLPSLQGIMGTVALPPVWLLWVLAVGLVNVTAIEFGKWALRHWKLNGD